MLAELLVGERLDLRFEGVDLGDERTEPLDFTLVLRADDLGEDLTEHYLKDAPRFTTRINLVYGKTVDGAKGPASPGKAACRQGKLTGRFATSLGAGFLLREKLERIEELAVGEHLVVEVVRRRAAGVANVADDVAAIHLRRPL